MTTLVLGATGATGRLLVEQLLTRGENVRVIVRSPDKLPETVTKHANLSLIQASLLALSDAQMAQHVRGCSAVASCLGHNMNVKGLFGHPRRLVTDATHRLCKAIQSIQANQPDNPIKFVLMNTAGNSNRDIHEPISTGQQAVIGLLRLLLPPHVDNEQAADYLRSEIGQSNRGIEWAVVRPDTLIDAAQVSEYSLHPSPTRSALFDPGRTSRINVAHFMAELITNEAMWKAWKGQMPVIYNSA